MTPTAAVEIRELDASFARWDDLLALIHRSFASMNGVIDPPSSALLLNPESLARKLHGERAFLATAGDVLAGCMFCRAEPPDCLYIGKLALAPEFQGLGIARRLVTTAERVARELDLPALRLEVRIELTGNHRRFEAMGFAVSAEGRHPGYDRTTYLEMRKPLA